MIAAAWDIGLWQFSGGADWMDKALYDIEAKPAADSGKYSLRHTRFGVGDEQLRLMLQTLLAERFQVKIRREVKEGDVFLLEMSGKAWLLKETKYSEDRPVLGAPGFSGDVEYVGGHFYLFDTSMEHLAQFASTHVLHKPVIDRTGMKGSYDYRDPDAKTEQESDLVGSFPVFIRDVGLKLTRSRGDVETFVIESAEKPSPN